MDKNGVEKHPDLLLDQSGQHGHEGLQKLDQR